MSGALRLVVFDVDGTLVDSQNHIVAAMSAAFGEVELQMPPRAKVLSIVGLSLPQAMAVLVPDAAEPTRARMVDAYKAAFQRVRAGAAELSPLFDGAREALHALNADAGTLLGLATGKSRRGLDHVLETHALRGLFVTEQVADHHPSKPHPAMLKAALAETGVASGQAVIIGDTTYDIEMGRAAGVSTIGVSWGYHRPEQLLAARADRVIDRFDDLQAALDDLWGARV